MTDAKKAEKKKKILNTAMALFQKNTVAQTAVDDIVKSAGIARGTFYLYFKDKSDLLEQIIMLKSRETMMGVFGGYTEELFDGSYDFLGLAESMLNKYIDFLLEESDTLFIVRKNISSIMRKAPDFGDEEANRFFESVLLKMTAFGYERSCAIKTVYLVVDMVGSACSDAILTGEPCGIDEMREYVISAAMAILKNGKDFSFPEAADGGERIQ